MQQNNESTAEHSFQTPKRRRGILRKLVLGTLIFVLALVIIRVGWGWHATRCLNAQIAKYRAAGQPVLPDDLTVEPIPDAENAAVVLRQAAAKLTQPALGTPSADDFAGHPEACAEHAGTVDRILADNAEALALLHQARDLPRAQWRTSFPSPLINIMLPDLSSMRQLAKLGCVAAMRAHQMGDDAAAVTALRDVLALARHVEDDEPFLIAHLVRIAIDALAMQTLEDLLPTLRVAGAGDVPPGTTPVAREEMDALFAELLDEENLRAGWVDAMHGERMMQLDCVQLICDRKVSVSNAGASPPNALDYIAALLLGPAWRLDGVRMMEYSTGFAEAGRQPDYPAAQAAQPAAPLPVAGVQRLTRMLSALLLPSLERALELHYRVLGERRATVTALALRLYELEHGARPEALAALVPEYLPALPADPFSAGGAPLGYLPHADEPLLYSVGKNGLDDGGAYALRSSGGVDSDGPDMPFFLNGDRPRAAPKIPAASQPAQALEDVPDVEPADGDQQTEQDPQQQDEVQP